EPVAVPIPLPSARVFGCAMFQPAFAEYAKEACKRRLPPVALYGSSEVPALFSLQPMAATPDARVHGARLSAARPDAEGQIEDALKRIPVAADVQVVAVEIAGQMRSVAFVIAKPGTTPKEADVIAPAGKIMAAFKVPARVWYVEEFPTVESANGVKIQRGKLRDMALERLRDDQGSISRR